MTVAAEAADGTAAGCVPVPWPTLWPPLAWGLDGLVVAVAGGPLAVGWPDGPRNARYKMASAPTTRTASPVMVSTWSTESRRLPRRSSSKSARTGGNVTRSLRGMPVPGHARRVARNPLTSPADLGGCGPLPTSVSPSTLVTRRIRRVPGGLRAQFNTVDVDPPHETSFRGWRWLVLRNGRSDGAKLIGPCPQPSGTAPPRSSLTSSLDSELLADLLLSSLHSDLARHLMASGETGRLTATLHQLITARLAPPGQSIAGTAP